MRNTPHLSQFSNAGRRAAELWLTTHPATSPRQYRTTCFRSLTLALGRIEAPDACHEAFDRAFKARIAAARKTDIMQTEVPA